jgi:hypothetical protein
MNPYLLKKSENAYELKIRGQSEEGTADDLRRRLAKFLKDDTPLDRVIIANLDIDDELNECEQRYEDLGKIVSEYDGDTTDTEAQRIQARALHYYHRVERVEIEETDVAAWNRRSHLLQEFKEIFEKF